ncbi:MAG TPA: DUF2279 domain-containing protein [Gemmatimonadaceae bacterium]|nr:DUF2279 domain-containing protein [Gemmatimonadaceae bacterium]
MRGLVLALSLSLGAGHQAGDKWLAPDKLKHFFMSAFIESASYSALRGARVSHHDAIVSAAGIAVSVGLAKELHDTRTGEGFSLRDLTWDAAGTAAGAAFLSHAR